MLFVVLSSVSTPAKKSSFPMHDDRHQLRVGSVICSLALSLLHLLHQQDAMSQAQTVKPLLVSMSRFRDMIDIPCSEFFFFLRLI